MDNLNQDTGLIFNLVEDIHNIVSIVNSAPGDSISKQELQKYLDTVSAKTNVLRSQLSLPTLPVANFDSPPKSNESQPASNEIVPNNASTSDNNSVINEDSNPIINEDATQADVASAISEVNISVDEISVDKLRSNLNDKLTSPQKEKDCSDSSNMSKQTARRGRSVARGSSSLTHTETVNHSSELSTNGFKNTIPLSPFNGDKLDLNNRQDNDVQQKSDPSKVIGEKSEKIVNESLLNDESGSNEKMSQDNEEKEIADKQLICNDRTQTFASSSSCSPSLARTTVSPIPDVNSSDSDSEVTYESSDSDDEDIRKKRRRKRKEKRKGEKKDKLISEAMTGVDSCQVVLMRLLDSMITLASENVTLVEKDIEEQERRLFEEELPRNGFYRTSKNIVKRKRKRVKKVEKDDSDKEIARLCRISKRSEKSVMCISDDESDDMTQKYCKKRKTNDDDVEYIPCKEEKKEKKHKERKKVFSSSDEDEVKGKSNIKKESVSLMDSDDDIHQPSTSRSKTNAERRGQIDELDGLSDVPSDESDGDAKKKKKRENKKEKNAKKEEENMQLNEESDEDRSKRAKLLDKANNCLKDRKKRNVEAVPEVEISDTSDIDFAPKKKVVKEKKEKKSKKKESESENENESESESDTDLDPALTSDDESAVQTSSDEEDKKKSKKSKKGKGKAGKKDEKEKKEKKNDGKKKRRRVVKPKDSSDDDVEILSDEEKSPTKGRKNIKKILTDKELKQQTKEAAEAEVERVKRMEAKQKEYHELIKTRNVSDDVKEVILEFDKKKKEPLLIVDSTLSSQLKPHQAEGIKCMFDCTMESVERLEKSDGSGCILAHSMGLGKTLQVITFLHTVMSSPRTSKLVKKAMVICPVNTAKNWASEFEHWLYDNSLADFMIFEMCEAKSMPARVALLKEWMKKGGVLIIGYTLFASMVEGGRGKKPPRTAKKVFEEALVEPGADIVICDEGHLLKNSNTSYNKAVNKVRTMRRVILTGTPLQNNLKEYYVMVNFVKPNLLGTHKEFDNRFVNPITNGQHVDSTTEDVKLMKKRVHILHKLLAGCVHRCDYNVLTPYLQPKYEYVMSVKLTETQIKLYRHYLETQTDRTGRTVLPDYSVLRLIWSHPWLVFLHHQRQLQKKDDSEEEGFIDDDSDAKSTPEEDSDCECLDEAGELELATKKRRTRSQKKVESGDEEVIKNWGEEERVNRTGLNGEGDAQIETWFTQFVQSSDDVKIELSSKFILLFAIMDLCETIGDKLLVFTSSLDVMDLFEGFLYMKNEESVKNKDKTNRWEKNKDYFRIDGGTGTDFRKNWIDKFNEPDNHRARLFMLSTRAGSLGVNLVGANRCVIFDASWNPTHDVQAIFRIFRFGQEKPVYVYRFLAQGSMEEKIYERQIMKQSLACRVVDEQQITRHFKQNELSELYQFNPDESTERETFKLPKDRMLADLLIKHKDLIVSYHEHDSLLENKPEEDLTEEERQSAWTEYEQEKDAVFQREQQAKLMAEQRQQQYVQQQQLFAQQYAAAQQFQITPPPIIVNNTQYDFLPYEKLTVEGTFNFLKNTVYKNGDDMAILVKTEEIFNEGFSKARQYITTNQAIVPYIANQFQPPEIAQRVANYTNAYRAYNKLQTEIHNLREKKYEILKNTAFQFNLPNNSLAPAILNHNRNLVNSMVAPSTSSHMPSTVTHSQANGQYDVVNLTNK